MAQKVIFVLIMIIEGDSDHSGTICDLLNSDLFKRSSQYQLFETLGKCFSDILPLFGHVLPLCKLVYPFSQCG